ncbi:Trm112 family protein [Mesorhizobium sp. CN2-181]|uniref:Trm112 family protein n=1 Tax=Mesorhizobium yinganensis TaxID=3157707 RepID=UPI0032B7474F
MRDEADRKKVDVKLLELLVCPLTKGPLTFDRENCELVSRVAKLAYPIRDGIPVMLPSEARPISDDGVPQDRSGAASP